VTQTNVLTINLEVADLGILSATVWFSGCKIKCEGCQNQTLLDFQRGMYLDEIKTKLTDLRKITNKIIYLGGNPLDSIDDLKQVIQIASDLDYHQFLFSGYSFDELVAKFDIQTHDFLVQHLDFIKTGKYDRACESLDQSFRFATTNQEVFESDGIRWLKVYDYLNRGDYLNQRDFSFSR